MRKNILKLFMLIMVCFLANDVLAADFSFGKPTRKDNVTTLPLSINISNDDAVSNVKFGCETNDTDVSCKIEAKQPSGISVVSDANGYVFSDTSEAGTNFKAGSILLANLIITNDSTSKKTVTINLKNGDITQAKDVELTKSINTDVNAKVAPKVASSDATLKNVKISQGKLDKEFSKDEFEYTIYNIADTINSIKFTPVCNDANTCSFTLSGGKSVSGTSVKLEQGENTVKLLVESEDGKNQNTYTFKVYRGETDINASTLKELSITGFELTPVFAKDTLDYAITVPNTVTTIKDLISYKSSDENASVEVKGLDDELIVGDNTITISVTNADKSKTSVYKLVVTREIDANIELVRYINDEVTFKDSTGVQTTLPFTEFELKYPDIALKIKNNEYQFDEDGNLVTEEEMEEEVLVKKNSKNKLWLIIILLVLGIIIIVVSGILIFKKKKPLTEEEKNKKSKNKKDYIEEKKEPKEEEINEENQENEEYDEDKTVDVDEALNDLMNTKQYDFDELNKMDE